MNTTKPRRRKKRKKQTPQQPGPIKYKTRPRIKPTAAGQHRIFDSVCECFRLIESTTTEPRPVWYAIALHGRRERILSREKTRAAAESANVNHARERKLI